MSKTAQNLKQSFATAGLVLTTMFASIGDGKLGQAFGPSAAHAQDDGTQVVMAIENPNAVPVAHSPKQNLPVPAPEMTAVEKVDELIIYSLKGNGIGVFVNMAASPMMTAEQIVKGLEYQFSQADNGMGGKGIDNQIYVNQSRGNVTTITFFVKGTPFEYTLGKIRTGFSTVVKAHQQQQQHAAMDGDLVSALRP